MSESKLKHHRRQGYTVVLNEVVEPKKLSLRARGLLVTLLSKPDHWRFSTERLEVELLEGRDAIRGAMRELEEHGYVVRAKRQNDLGHWYTEVNVYESTTDSPTTGNPSVGSPSVGGSGATDSPESNPEKSAVKEKTSSSHGRASRAVPTTAVEIAREAERGTIRKSAQQEPERVVEAGHATQSGWPKRKQRDRKPATRRQRVAGVANRFAKDARARFPGEAMQVNVKAVDGALWKAAQESPDVTWQQLDRARELFFEQAARLHRPGVPAWQNFLYRIPRLVEAARLESGAGAAALEGAELAKWLDEDDSAKRGPMTQEELAKWLD